MFFVKKDFEQENKYNKWIKISNLFGIYGPGVETGLDKLFVSHSADEIKEVFNKLSLKDENDYNLMSITNKKSFKIKDKLFADNLTIIPICKYSYKAFDFRYIAYAKNSLRRADYSVFKHIINKKNIYLNLMRTFVDTSEFKSVFVTNSIIDKNLYSFQTYAFPLYLYVDKNSDEIFTEKSRKPNLNLEIVEQIAQKIGLEFVPEKSSPPVSGGVSTKGGRGGQKTKINNLPHLKTFRKELRNNLTPAEATLWTMLKNKQLEGRKFRRQHSVANYILDFYCPSEKLAIELDGQGHFEATQAEYDYERDLFLNTVGIKVLRFENKEVFNNPEAVLESIKEEFGWRERTTPSANADTPPLQGGELKEVFAPIDILDYIYAVLHSPTYREKYKEFLKIDFPRVPYPKDKETFWQLVKLGGELRQIHLLESPKVEEYITSYPIDGDNTITTKISKKDWEITDTEKQLGRIWINESQYFDNIPLTAWEFYIGGYQPAQKWLKDRKGRTLTFEDILHYQKIIVALYETDRLMKEIDKIDVE